MMTSDLSEHPAIVAWRGLRPERMVPNSVEMLGARPHSTIYRLTGVGRDGTAVIAKRSPAPDAMIERAVYEEVLPDVPVSSPHFYGMASDGDTCGWLFMEDVGDTRFSPASSTHRTLAAQWLGRLHSAAARLDAAGRLPDRGPAHYLGHLRAGRETIDRNRHNPALSPEDRDILKAVSAQCDALELGWEEIDRFCADLPATLVHGDFRSKNVRVRRLGSEMALFPIDWETAGWGVPAPDLVAPRGMTQGAHVELGTYASIAREYWPRLDAATLEELVIVGGVFRRLAAISWASLSLAYPAPQKAVASMRVYQGDLRHLCRHWAPVA